MPETHRAAWGMARQEIFLVMPEIRDMQARQIPLSHIFERLCSEGKIVHCKQAAFYRHVNKNNEAHTDQALENATTSLAKIKQAKASELSETSLSAPISSDEEKGLSDPSNQNGPTVIDASKNLSPAKRQSKDPSSVIDENW